MTTRDSIADVLFGNNMLLPVGGVVEIGGFDELFSAGAGEDNDLCFRWLRDGRRLEYRPELVVSHHDWRTPEQLESLYERYGYANGQFYIKHIRHANRRLFGDLVRALMAGMWAGLIHALAARDRRPLRRCSEACGLVSGTGFGPPGPTGASRLARVPVGLRQLLRSSLTDRCHAPAGLWLQRPISVDPLLKIVAFGRISNDIRSCVRKSSW